MLSFIKSAVTSCPYVTASQGVVHIPPELLAELAGLVNAEDDEFALVAKGRRDEVEFWLESFWVPAQKRSGGNVEIASIQFGDDDIAFIHSHHTMGAFFSPTDIKELNPLRPLSIVIARGTEKLGFAYKAEVQATLPCGDLGVIPVKILPQVEDWPWPEVPVIQAAEKFTTFGGCPNKKSVIHDKFWISFDAACGLSLPDKQPLASAFGKTTNLLVQIQATEKIQQGRKPADNLPAAYQKKGGQPKQHSKEGTRGNRGSLSASNKQPAPSLADVPGIWRNSYKCRCGGVFYAEGCCYEELACLACKTPTTPHHSKWLRDEDPPEQLDPRFIEVLDDGLNSGLERLEALIRVTDDEPSEGRTFKYRAWYHCGEEGCWFDWEDLAEGKDGYAECPKCNNPTFPWRQLERDISDDVSFNFGANQTSETPERGSYEWFCQGGDFGEQRRNAQTEQSDDAALEALQEHLLNDAKVVQKTLLLTTGHEFQPSLVHQYD